MASCQTTQWVSTSPYVKMTVTKSSDTATITVLTWVLEYIASYAASTSVAKSYTVTVNGKTVKSGTYSINGKTGTNSIATGTVTINKTTSAQTIGFGFSFAFNLTWSGVYKGTLGSGSSISVSAKTSYAIKYNANGGSGAPGSQTKWHGTTLTLSSTKPTRTNYTFSKWNTNASGTGTSYSAGGSYTANAAATLYAIWTKTYSDPIIKNYKVTRCDSSGTTADEGTYALIKFNWTTTNSSVTITIKWKKSTETSYSSTLTLSSTTNSDSVSQIIGDGTLDTESTYDILVDVNDGDGNATATRILASVRYPLDFLYEGKGTAIGKAASRENTFDVGWTTHLDRPLCMGNKYGSTILDGCDGVFLSHEGYMHLQRANGQGYDPYIGFLVGDETSCSGRIGIDQATGYMYFSDAGRYDFGASVYIKGNIRMVQGAYSDGPVVMQCLWADAAPHNLIERRDDGLTAAFGFAGTDSYATVALIRGRTCKYQNSSGTTTLSDVRLKQDFTDLSKWESFYDSIEPCAFRLKTGSRGRFHIGYKAQQIEQALLDSGLTTEDFAGFIKMPYLVDEDDPNRTKTYEEAGIEEGTDEYGLIYTEFVALNTYKIQKLQKENDELRNEISDLKSRLDKLEAMLAANNE